MILPRRRLSIHAIAESFERTAHNNNNTEPPWKGRRGDEKKKTMAPVGAVVVGRHPSLTDSTIATDEESHSGRGEEEHQLFQSSWEVPASAPEEEDTTIVFGEEEEDEETTIVFGNSSGGGEHQEEEDCTLASKLGDDDGGDALMSRLHYAHDMLANMNVGAKGGSSTSRRATMAGGTRRNSNSAHMPRGAKASRRVTYTPAAPMWMDSKELDLSQPIASPEEEQQQKIEVKPIQANRNNNKRRSLPVVKLELPKGIPSLFPASMATSPSKLANEIRRRKSDIFDRRKAQEAAEAARKQEEAIMRKQKEEEEAAKRRQAEAAKQRRLQQEAEKEAAATKRRQAAEKQQRQQQREQQQKAEEEKKKKAAATDSEKVRAWKNKSSKRTRSTTADKSSTSRQDLASIVATKQQATRRKSTPLQGNNNAQGAIAATTTTPRRRRSTATASRQDLASIVAKTQTATTTSRRKSAPIIVKKNASQSMVKKEENKAAADAIEKVKATKRKSKRTRSTTANSSRQDLASIVVASNKQVSRRRKSSTPVIVEEEKNPIAVLEEEDEEEEIKALKERIAKLESKLEETTTAEETEIQQIQQDTHQQKEDYRIQKGVMSNKERATLMVNTVKRGVTLRAMKRIIVDLQGSTRNYRMVIRNLSANLEELYEQKHQLLQSMKWARIQSMKNSTKMGDKEDQYFGLTEHLPDYRHWIDGLEKEQIRRSHLIQYEQRMLMRYNQAMDTILSKVFQLTSNAESEKEQGNNDYDDLYDDDFEEAIRKAANTKKHAKAAKKAARRHSKSSRTIVYEYITRKVPAAEV